MTGTTVSHYHILERLGGGGMGVVYKAEDTKLGRQVALKFLPEDLSNDPHSLERFQKEARAASSLNHPNICTIYEIDEHQGKPFIAMELLEGQTLKRRLADGLIAGEELVDLAIQLVNALDAAHAKGIVHRDIKPSNIFITQKGQAKILDFGLATREAEGGPLKGISAADQKTASAGQLTKSGEAVGTLMYMSPEQLQGEPLDVRTDIYSLGTVLYEMATGQIAFFRNASAATRLPELPADLQRIIFRALEQERQMRYQTAADLLAELQRLKRTHDSVRTTSRAPRPRKAVDSLAVLPFENASGDPEKEYLSDGLTESIINQLAGLPKLKVMARSTVFRYKAQVSDPQAVGRTLGVRAVLAGRVLEQRGRLRIKTELVDVADGTQIWGEEYDRPPSDLFAVQEEISQHISEQLRLKLGSVEKKRVSPRPAVNPEAYKAYLQGRYHWNRRTMAALHKSVEYFVEAADKDPQYAAAYAGLADCYNMLGWYRALPPRQSFARGKMAARRALEIDDGLAEAQASLAWSTSQFDWNWELATQGFQRASQLNPNYAPTYHFGAVHWVALGRFEDAVASSRRALELEPLSLVFASGLGLCLLYLRQFEEAEEQYRKVLEMEPNFFPAHLFLGRTYQRAGRWEEAIAELQAAYRVDENTWALAELGSACAEAGKSGEAHLILEQLSREGRYVSPVDRAILHAGLNEKNEALDWLEKAFADRSCGLTMLQVDPRFDSLRQEPRFQEYIRRMAFPS